LQKLTRLIKNSYLCCRLV